MKKILFVCQANVGRSQMAEAFYNSQTGSTAASSAGVEDFREKYHHRPIPEIIQTMAEKHIDISDQRITFLQPQMVEEADQVVVLCNKTLCPDFLRTSSKVVFREVTDPFEKSPETIRQIRDQIETLVLEFV